MHADSWLTRAIKINERFYEGAHQSLYNTYKLFSKKTDAKCKKNVRFVFACSFLLYKVQCQPLIIF